MWIKDLFLRMVGGIKGEGSKNPQDPRALDEKPPEMIAPIPLKGVTTDDLDERGCLRPDYLERRAKREEARKVQEASPIIGIYENWHPDS